MDHGPQTTDHGPQILNGLDIYQLLKLIGLAESDEILRRPSSVVCRLWSVVHQLIHDNQQFITVRLVKGNERIYFYFGITDPPQKRAL